MSSPPDETPLRRRNGGYGGQSPELIARANGKEQLGAGASVLCPASGCSLRHGSIGQSDDAYNEQQRRDPHACALNQVFESLSLAHSIFAAQATRRPHQNQSPIARPAYYIIARSQRGGVHRLNQ
jgi:hypothetical protein